jgi:hypothetical protein
MKTDKTKNENIICTIEEKEDETMEDLEEMLNDFENIEYQYETTEEMYVSMDHYDKNYTVKQLQQICDYYSTVGMKMEKGKKKKQDLICEIVLFEENEENIEIVSKRKELWYYIEELKRDTFMKKYVLGF